jgi:hypothetical protein
MAVGTDPGANDAWQISNDIDTAAHAVPDEREAAIMLEDAARDGMADESEVAVLLEAGLPGVEVLGAALLTVGSARELCSRNELLVPNCEPNDAVEHNTTVTIDT